MDLWSFLELAASAVTGALTVVGAAWWLLKRKLNEDFASRESHNGALARIARGEQRIADVETKLTHMPSQRDFQGLLEGVSRITGVLEGFGGKLDALQTQVNILIKNEMGGK